MKFSICSSLIVRKQKSTIILSVSTFIWGTMKTDRIIKCCAGQLLTIATVAGVVLGAIVGLVLRATTDTPWTDRNVMYVNFIGELFLRMLKGLILPLIISSLIAAIGSLDLSLSGRIGVRAIAYYMITTFMAVILGIFLVVTIQPGIDRDANNAVSTNQSESNAISKFRHTTTTDTLLDLIRNMFPPNLVQACVAQFQTVLVAPVDNRSKGMWWWFIFIHIHYTIMWICVLGKHSESMR